MDKTDSCDIVRGGAGEMLGKRWNSKIVNLVGKEMYLFVEIGFKESYEFHTKYYEHQK